MFDSLIVDLKDETKTIQFAHKFADYLSIPAVLAFSGDLGAGKTTLIRGMLRVLGVQGSIKSPTFALVESYDLPSGDQIHHFDLYRLENNLALDAIGFRDYLIENTLCCIEWPERSSQLLSVIDLWFGIHIHDPGRRLKIDALTTRGQQILSSFSKANT